MRTQFQRILDRIGVAHWPKLLHALRSSRQAEPAAEYPVNVAAAWLGNSPAVAAKHDLLVRETDLRKTTQSVPDTKRSEPHPGQKMPEYGSVRYGTNVSVETKGIEPSTPALQTRCSPN